MAIWPGLLSRELSMPPDPRFTWSSPAQIPVTAGLAGALAGVGHDCVLIAGGTNFPKGMPWEGGKKKYYDGIYVLTRHPLKGYEWLVRGDQHLPEPMAYSACVTTEKGVVCVGGENEHGPSKKVWRMIWDGTRVRVEPLPDLPLPLTNASAGMLNGHIYVAGGETAANVSDKFYYLEDLAWRPLQPLPKPLSHAVLAGSHGHLYLAGGRKKDPDGISDLSSAVYSYDPVTNNWSQRQSLPYPLSAGTGIMTDNDKLFLFGGDKGETFHRTEELIVAIAAEKDPGRKQELIRQKTALQQTHPGFSKEILMYDILKDRWSVAGDIPFPSPVTTTVFQWGDRIVIPGGEIRAGVRTSQILMAVIKDE
ncbi:MAG TPA: hypothetical protein VHC48_13410 [Puia sp.]|nr:hypothetical protein [Puia sp.]